MIRSSLIAPLVKPLIAPGYGSAISRGSFAKTALALSALVAVSTMAEFCRRLYAGGVRDFHFYTLNRAEQAYAICHLLGLRAKES